MLQLKFIAVLISDGDEIRAKFFTHIGHHTFLFFVSYFSLLRPKMQEWDLPNF